MINTKQVLNDRLIYRWRVFINADQDMTLKDFLSLTADHTPIDTADLHVNGGDMDKFLRAYAKLKN